MPTYMRVKQGGKFIKGKVTTKGFEGWIELASFSFPPSQNNIGIVGRASESSSKIILRSATAVKTSDDASTALAHIATDGKLIEFDVAF